MIPMKTKLGDMLRTIILSQKQGGKFSPDFLDEVTRAFNELGERLEAAEKKIEALEQNVKTVT